MQKPSKLAQTPQIRFAGFTKPWEIRKFSDTFVFLQNNNLSRAELTDLNGKIINIHYGDILIKYAAILNIKKNDLTYVLDNSIIKKYQSSTLQNGDIIIADAAEDQSVGKCSEITGLTNEIVLSGLHTIPCRPNEKYAKGFLGHYMNSNSYHDQLLPLLQGTKVSSISKSALQNTDIIYPTNQAEQQKIGELFANLDNLITLHQSKFEKLQKIKKSCLQNLFPQNNQNTPKIRFKNFSDEWVENKLGETVERYYDETAIPKNGYERLGIRSHGKGTFHTKILKGQELETGKMFRVKKDNLIVNITFAWEHAVAITDDLDDGKLVSHRFPQFSMKENMISKFLKYLILDKKFKYHLWLSSPGGAGRNRVLKIDAMLDYSLNIPKSTQEQEKIGAFFSKLDKLITLHQSKFEKLQKIKKSCLQNMFV